MRTTAAILALALAVVLALPAVAAAPEGARVALIIGNGDYRSMDPLEGVADDVSAVGRALEGLGFAVTVATNLNNGGFRAALNTFSERLSRGDLAIFYFMGYAVQVKGRNFLLPVGVDIRREFDLLTRGVAIDAIAYLMESAGAATSVLLFDAAYPDRVSATQSWAKPGLAEPKGGAPQRLVAMSAQPNAEIPPPGRGGSLFARELAVALQQPPVELVAALEALAQRIETVTGGRQRPWVDPGFSGLIQIGPPGAAPAAETEQATLPSTDETGEAGGAPEPPDREQVTTLPPPTETPAEPVDERAFDRGLTAAQRGQVQRDLKDLGFYDGSIDQSFGPGTRAGISRYQREIGEPPTGYLTESQAEILATLADERRAALEAERRAEEARLEELRKEQERQEAERKEAERKEAERKEAERKEAERKEAERKEAERKEAERKEAEQREAERQQAEEAERQRQQQAATPRTTELERLMSLAEKGDPKAQAALGLRYFHGRGVERDHAKALFWYRKAADQGEASAQTNLGFLYFNGFGVEKDLAQAAQWLRRAAEQGQREAQFNLGLLYENGTGVPRSYDEAAKWYREAAAQGVAEASSRLQSLKSRSLIQ